MTSKKQMKSASRLYAVQALFQMEASEQGMNEVRDQFINHRFGATLEGQEYVEGNVELFEKLLFTAVNEQAAIDQMTRVMGVEQTNKINPVHTLSIYPGVVDTQMQGEIRNSKSEDFSNIEKFKDMKTNNELASPQSVAQLVYKIDKDSSLDNGSVVTVRDYS